PPQPHLGHAAGGAGFPRARRAPGMVALPLCSRPNASPFWIMLLLVLGKLDNAMIRVRVAMACATLAQRPGLKLTFHMDHPAGAGSNGIPISGAGTRRTVFVSRFRGDYGRTNRRPGLWLSR